jgi:catechol 2,3-dioxygenase-like lactoylglutathione lyase family enzyme
VRHVPARHVLTILAVDDLERAERFYAGAFDWRVTVSAPPYRELELPGGQRLGLYRRPGFERNTGAASLPRPSSGTTSTELYLHVDDVAQASARLLAAGARCLSPSAPRDWGDEAAYFADPDGNVVVVARPLTGDSP